MNLLSEKKKHIEFLQCRETATWYWVQDLIDDGMIAMQCNTSPGKNNAVFKLSRTNNINIISLYATKTIRAGMEVTVPYNGSASRRVPKQREKQDIENKIIAEAIAKTSSRLIAAK